MFFGFWDALAVTVRGTGLTGRVIGLMNNPWVVDCVNGEKIEDLRMFAARESMVSERCCRVNTKMVIALSRIINQNV